MDKLVCRKKKQQVVNLQQIRKTRNEYHKMKSIFSFNMFGDSNSNEFITNHQEVCLFRQLSNEEVVLKLRNTRKEIEESKLIDSSLSHFDKVPKKNERVRPNEYINESVLEDFVNWLEKQDQIASVSNGTKKKGSQSVSCVFEQLLDDTFPTGEFYFDKKKNLKRYKSVEEVLDIPDEFDEINCLKMYRAFSEVEGICVPPSIYISDKINDLRSFSKTFLK